MRFPVVNGDEMSTYDPPIAGSQEWREQRIGFATASRFREVISEPRSTKDKEAGKLSQSSLSYMYEVIGEIITGEPADSVSTPATRWGNLHEPHALQEYAEIRCVEVQRPYFVEHPQHRYVGCTVDSFIADDGNVEVKCPFSTKNHIRTVVERRIPSDYIPQVQGQLWVTGRQWCDFVSYDPRISDQRWRTVIVRVDRDEKMIAKIARGIERFSKSLLDALNAL